MIGLLNYYRLNTSDSEDDNCFKFTRVKEEDITICGKPLQEVINILNGLELERQLDIQLTMENLQEILKKLIDKQNKDIEEQIKMNLGVKK